MAPSKKGTRGWHGKRRATVARCSHLQHRKRLGRPRQAQTSRPINVPELVCRLLNLERHNQAAPFRETERRGRNGRSLNSKGGFYEKMQKYQDLDEPSYDTVSARESSASIDESEYTKSMATSTENLSRAMEATNSSVAAISENSSVSNISMEPITLTKSIDNTRALLKKKSLVQIINNYIKAGIEEGKRQAKKYIRKALSFGVKSGYLIPADPRGQIIRVSPTLVESSRSDAESRKKRRRARRGEDDDVYVDRSKRRRETPLQTTKKKVRREASPEPTPPRKRRKTSASKASRMNLCLTETSGKKDSRRQGRQGENKKKSAPTKKKDKVINYNLAATSKRSDENLKRRKREQQKRRKSRTKQRDEVIEKKLALRHRASKSPSRARKNENNNAQKGHRDSSEENGDSAKSSDNEVNQRTLTERRKSPSTCREVLPLEDNEFSRNPARNVTENLEPPNIEGNNNNDVFEKLD